MEARARLSGDDVYPGDFIVRQSQSASNSYTLDMRFVFELLLYSFLDNRREETVGFRIVNVPPAAANGTGREMEMCAPGKYIFETLELGP